MARGQYPFVDSRQQLFNLVAAGIYCITDTRNGLRYVGSTTKEFRRRWRQHRADLRANRHKNPRLQAVWNKHGDVFVFSIIRYCPPEHCLVLEQVFIDHFESAKQQCGYNMAPNAGSTLGLTLSDEAKAKISAAIKSQGRTISPELQAKMTAGLREWDRTNKRAPATDQHRENLSKALRGRTFSEESRQKMSAAKKGKPLKPEHKAKVLESLEKAKLALTPEVYAKVSKSNKGRQFSEEHRAKLSASRANIVYSDEHRDNISKSNRGRKHTPEHNAKVSAALRGKPRKRKANSVLLEVVEQDGVGPSVNSESVVDAVGLL